MKRFGKIKHFLLLVLVCLLIPAGVYSQRQEADSLLTVLKKVSGEAKIDVLVRLGRLYYALNPDSALYFAKLVLENAEADGSRRLMGIAYNEMGNANTVRHDFAQAKKDYERAYEYRKQSGDTLRMAYTLTNLAELSRDIGQHNDAVAYTIGTLKLIGFTDSAYRGKQLLFLAYEYDFLRDLNRALEPALKASMLYKQLKDTTKLTESYVLIAYIHSKLGNMDMARSYFKQSRELCQFIHGQPYALFTIYNNMGITASNLFDYKTSLEFYYKCLEICEEHGLTSNMALTYGNIGFAYSDLGEYEQAIEAYKKYLKIYGEDNITDDLLNNYNNMVSTYIRMGDIANAQKYSAIVEKNISTVQNVAVIEEAFQLFSKIAVINKNYKKAYEYANLEKSYRDTIFKRERQRDMFEAQARYDSQIKDREIELLQNEKIVSELQIKKQVLVRRLFFVTIVFLILYVIFTVVVVWLIKKKSRSLAQMNLSLEEVNEQLKVSEGTQKEMNLTKDKLFSIIAHDLKNPFSSLKSFSELLVKEFDTISHDELKEYIGMIHESAENLYKLLDNLLQWSRSQIGSITYTPEILDIVDIIYSVNSDLKVDLEQKKVQINIISSENHLIFADRNTLTTVMRNLLNNAVRFTAEGTSVEVTLNHLPNTQLLEVVVVDHGVGISQSDIKRLFDMDATFATQGIINEPGTGLGLILCKEFVENNGGNIWVKSEMSKGSQFHFTVPIAPKS